RNIFIALSPHPTSPRGRGEEAGGTDMLRTLTQPLPEGEERKQVVLTRPPLRSGYCPVSAVADLRCWCCAAVWWIIAAATSQAGFAFALPRVAHRFIQRTVRAKVWIANDSSDDHVGFA